MREGDHWPPPACAIRSDGEGQDIGIKDRRWWKEASWKGGESHTGRAARCASCVAESMPLFTSRADSTTSGSAPA